LALIEQWDRTTHHENTGESSDMSRDDISALRSLGYIE
jgi:hypothetical protein